MTAPSSTAAPHRFQLPQVTEKPGAPTPATDSDAAAARAARERLEACLRRRAARLAGGTQPRG